MPTKKNTGRKPRRSRKKKNADIKRMVLFTSGFLLLLFLAVFALYLYKSNTSGPVINQSRLATAIERTDEKLLSAYFDLGVSSENVRSEKPEQREKGEINWEYKDIVIQAPRSLSRENIKETITESVSDVPGLSGDFSEGALSVTAILSIEDIETHRIKFIYKAPEGAEKIVEKKEEPASKEKRQELVDKESEKLKDHIKEYEKTSSEKPKVVIIVDDIGMSKSSVDKLLDIPAPITIAVLPNLPYSEYAATEAHKKGREVMLHLPMEPKESSGYTAVDAGEDALVVGLPKSEIKRRIEVNLASVPHIQGVNNHMGSKFMESEELLELVMEEVKEKDLFFVDSMTSGASMGSEAASKFGVRSAERDIFLRRRIKGVLLC